MRKCWKLVIAISSVFLVVLLLWFIFFYNPVPRLSETEKDKIEAKYYACWIPNRKHPERDPLIWYDENGRVEEEYVWRYIGTYGDCYAFLMIGDNVGATYGPVDLPYLIQGLSREVYYPIEARVVLYNTHTAYELEYYGDELQLLVDLNYYTSYREEWLTDAQLEQLTRDIAEIAKAYN